MSSDKIISEMGRIIVGEYAGLMTPASQDFMLHYENFSEPVLKSEDELLKVEYGAACNTLRTIWDHYNVIKVQEGISTVAPAESYERLGELFRNFNDDVDGFTEKAKQEIL